MKSFSAATRQSNIQAMKQQKFDLAIIGGGITGAGVARDAASRGMKVALIEANDFAFGTSSRSSKLVHGGYRYLENLEFGLVFEALSERRLLFSMAPHLVHPLRFIFPIYEDSRLGMNKMGLGMLLYDTLALFETPQMHERLGPSTTLSRLPFLRDQGLVGSYAYSDAYMDDDRLVVETLRSATDWGALCANYTKAVGARFEGDQVKAIDCEDLESGERFEIQAQHFVSTVGPWTDRVGQSLLGTWQKLMRPSKGIHLTLPRDRVPVSSAVVMGADKQKRIVFLIPRHEMVIVGTTDTDFPDDPGEVCTKKEDVRYLLRILDEYFPGAKLTEGDVISSYAGVRPLVHDDSLSESGTSREHLIHHDERNVTFVTGGKYTTYRHMSEQAVDAVLGFFSIEDRVRFARNRTKEPLNPLVTLEAYWKNERLVPRYQAQTGIGYEQIKLLLDRHGLEAEQLMEIYLNLAETPDPWERYWQAEALFAMENTMCLHLADFYLRRSPLFLADRGRGAKFLSCLNATFATQYGWNDAKQKEERDRLMAHVRRELAWMESIPVFE
ncbi:MAG: glycerol-3-phosphate dehydrogenase/oxidase [Bdellovibrionaceae bacterium]|nr:glycerol-3-phosphate dehydrogenase/oxidase [Bdellovibrionales bacterium]MCB9086202.1 glycerol-3-phosphate dehydrogenase/oxidase [Pseudobdellovibrionaceae bacterium]